MKLRRLFNFKYPKFISLAIAIILAYILFKNQNVAGFVSGLENLKYLGVFIAGLFFSFGFTTPFAIGFFITLNPSNIWLAGILGGIGAMLSDLIIFKFIKFSFEDEIKKFRKEKFEKNIENMVNHTLSHKIRNYLLFTIAGIII